MPLRHTYFTSGIVAALLCSLCSVPSVRGQERLTSTASNSPLQTEFENRSLRPGTDMRDAYLRNPALIHRMVGERRYFSAENPGFVREKPGTIFIAADGASGRQEGDYLPYEGQEFRDFSVRADGYKQGDRATFFARIGFTAGGNDNVGWSALRNPGLYWPYIVADSTGGDFRYEKYDLAGTRSGSGGSIWACQGNIRAILHSARTIPVSRISPRGLRSRPVPPIHSAAMS